METVQELNKRGIKNSELLKLAGVSDYILITYDKDFLNFKVEPEQFVILIDIHPLIDENVLPRFERFLKNFSPEVLKENIIILRDKETVIRKKKE